MRPRRRSLPTLPSFDEIRAETLRGRLKDNDLLISDITDMSEEESKINNESQTKIDELEAKLKKYEVDNLKLNHKIFKYSENNDKLKKELDKKEKEIRK